MSDSVCIRIDLTTKLYVLLSINYYSTLKYLLHIVSFKWIFTGFKFLSFMSSPFTIPYFIYIYNHLSYKNPSDGFIVTVIII